MQSFDEQSYFRFVTFLFTGSFAFQVLYDLTTAPVSVISKEHWAQLGKELAYASFTILAFVGVVNFEAHVKTLWLVPSILMFGVMVFRVIGHAQRVHKIVREIHSIEKQQR